MARNRSERRFLADQAADALTAIRQTVQEMRGTLKEACDVRTCTRQHPWIATGSAVAAGFVAGAVVSIPQAISAKRGPAKSDASAPAQTAEPDPARAKTGLLMSTLGTAFTSTVQTLLQSFVAAAVVAAEVDPVQKKERQPGRQPETLAFAADHLAEQECHGGPHGSP